MIGPIINKIRNDLIKTFGGVDNWFDVNESLLNYIPKNGGWNIRKVLEHISLTNYFLLILIKKGTIKSLEKARTENFFEILTNYDLDWSKLNQIGEYKLFEWNRPEHMEPTGAISLATINNKLHDQLDECLGYLNELKKGQGVLHKTMMTVNALGKIDVYHYIFFLAQHAKRHLTQMEKIREEFNRYHDD